MVVIVLVVLATVLAVVFVVAAGSVTVVVVFSVDVVVGPEEVVAFVIVGVNVVFWHCLHAMLIDPTKSSLTETKKETRLWLALVSS